MRRGVTNTQILCNDDMSVAGFATDLDTVGLLERCRRGWRGDGKARDLGGGLG